MRRTQPNQSFKGGGWLEPEEFCYPAGGFTRRAKAVVRFNAHNPLPLQYTTVMSKGLPYGSLRIVTASIPDTFSTIPARLRFARQTVKGFLSVDDGTLYFTPNAAERTP
jgi:hypothetical protein